MTNQQPRVFIPNWPMRRNERNERVRVDLAEAEPFGRLVELVERPRPGAIQPGDYTEDLLYKLRDFNDRDFILCVGNPTLMVAVALIALEMNKGQARFLQWLPFERKYAEWSVGQDFWDAVDAAVPGEHSSEENGE
jgi:hypothetical protein